MRERMSESRGLLDQQDSPTTIALIAETEVKARCCNHGGSSLYGSMAGVTGPIYDIATTMRVIR